MKKIKKVLSSILLIVCLCVYAALAMGSGDSSSSSTSGSSKSNNDYGGYSQEYWDAARDSWDKNK